MNKPTIELNDVECDQIMYREMAALSERHNLSVSVNTASYEMRHAFIRAGAQAAVEKIEAKRERIGVITEAGQFVRAPHRKGWLEEADDRQWVNFWRVNRHYSIVYVEKK